MVSDEYLIVLHFCRIYFLIIYLFTDNFRSKICEKNPVNEKEKSGREIIYKIVPRVVVQWLQSAWQLLPHFSPICDDDKYRFIFFCKKRRIQIL